MLEDGAEIELTTNCSTLCVLHFGEGKAKGTGLKLDQSALAKFGE